MMMGQVMKLSSSFHKQHKLYTMVFYYLCQFKLVLITTYINNLSIPWGSVGSPELIQKCDTPTFSVLVVENTYVVS